jgi:hypothetical protein
MCIYNIYIYTCMLCSTRTVSCEIRLAMAGVRTDGALRAPGVSRCLFPSWLWVLHHPAAIWNWHQAQMAQIWNALWCSQMHWLCDLLLGHSTLCDPWSSFHGPRSAISPNIYIYRVGLVVVCAHEVVYILH